MDKILVTTKEELQTAVDSGADEIIVAKELADKLKKAKKITTIGAVGLTAITALAGVAVFTAPFTAGTSLLFAAAPVAAFTGVEIAAIIIALAIGISLVIAVFKNYEEIELSDGKLKLRKKQKQA